LPPVQTGYPSPSRNNRCGSLRLIQLWLLLLLLHQAPLADSCSRCDVWLLLMMMLAASSLVKDARPTVPCSIPVVLLGGALRLRLANSPQQLLTPAILRMP